jgi:hypothetical protein
MPDAPPEKSHDAWLDVLEESSRYAVPVDEDSDATTIGSGSAASEDDHKQEKVINFRSHLMVPVVEGVVMIVERSDQDVSPSYGYHVSEICFAIDAAHAVVCGDVHHLKRDIELAHGRAAPGDAVAEAGSLGVYFEESRSSSIAKFDPYGRVQRQGSKLIASQTRKRILYSWGAVMIALISGLLSGPKDLLGRGLETIAQVDAMKMTLTNLLMHSKPDVVARTLRSGGDSAAVAPPAGAGAEPPERTGSATARPMTAGQTLSLNMRLRLLEGEGGSDAWASVSKDMRDFFFAPKTGLKFRLYAIARQKQKLAEEEVRQVLNRIPGLSEEEVGRFALPKGIDVFSTTAVVDEAARAWNQRTGRTDDGSCKPLELMTLRACGPLSDEELVVGEADEGTAPAGRRRYSAKRLNHFRMLLDAEFGMQSREYGLGLDRPLRLVLHELGAPHAVLDLLHVLTGAVASRRVNKQMRAGQAKRAHIINLAYLMGADSAGKQMMLAWDNFVRNLKVGKNLGGKAGSYVTQHLCHMAGKLLVCAPPGGALKIDDPSKEVGCWHCLSQDRPAAEEEAQSKLCRPCRQRPIDLFTTERMNQIKAMWTTMDCLDADGVPHMFADHFFEIGLGGDDMKLLSSVTASAGSVFNATEELLSLYALLREAVVDGSSYANFLVESVGHTKGSRVVALSRNDTNTWQGLLQHMR